ncbi:MAG: N-acetylmuramoyl-L-alanine amidase [Verrucomicrobiota bacterium]
MFRRSGIRRSMKDSAAWMGVLLMGVSFVWLVSMPRQPGEPASAQSSGKRASFGTVVLDPGHGGQDSGAMCGTVLEKDLTLDVAQRVGRLLQAEGLPTLMTRYDDTFVSLADRARFTNRVRDSVLISIHFNEGERPLASGVETYYADHQAISAPSVIAWIPFFSGPATTEAPNVESQSLAGFIQEALVARTGAVDRGAKPRQFFVITNVTRPAVLVEGGFLSNKEDIAKLGNSDYREQLAAAITEGALRYRDLLQQRRTTLAVTAPPPH